MNESEVRACEFTLAYLANAVDALAISADFATIAGLSTTSEELSIIRDQLVAVENRTYRGLADQ